jgi:RNA-directed DNA polymerase
MEQGKSIVPPVTAGKRQGTLPALWVKESGKACGRLQWTRYEMKHRPMRKRAGFRAVIHGERTSDQSSYEGRQMTATSVKVTGTGASSRTAQMWDRANWSDIEADVKRLPVRIVKATGKVDGATGVDAGFDP